MPGRNEIHLDQKNVGASLPSVSPPELFPINIVVVEKDIALHDPELFQLGQTPGHEARAKPFPAVRWRNRQVMQIAASTVVSAEYCPDDHSSVAGDKTHSRISLQETSYRNARV